MRKLVALLAGAGTVLLLLRRRRAPTERVSLFYGDGSMVTLEPGAPGLERLVGLARDVL